jgi:uracil-DNA glycosylase family 4
MELQEHIRACQLCPRHKNVPEGCGPIPGVGPIPATIMMVKDAISYYEMLAGEPIIGFERDILSQIFDFDKVYRASVVNCFNEATPKKAEIKTCRSWLDCQINLVKPKCVLLIGTNTAKYFFNHKYEFHKGVFIDSIWLGDQQPRFKCIYIPTWSPNYAIQRSKKDYEQYLHFLRGIRHEYS